MQNKGTVLYCTTSALNMEQPRVAKLSLTVFIPMCLSNHIKIIYFSQTHQFIHKIKFTATRFDSKESSSFWDPKMYTGIWDSLGTVLWIAWRWRLRVETCRCEHNFVNKFVCLAEIYNCNKFRKLRHKWENNVRRNFKGTRWMSVSRIHVAKDSVLRALDPDETLRFHKMQGTVHLVVLCNWSIVTVTKYSNYDPLITIHLCIIWLIKTLLECAASVIITQHTSQLSLYFHSDFINWPYSSRCVYTDLFKIIYFSQTHQFIHKIMFTATCFD
jgi:hypothetical protein